MVIKNGLTSATVVHLFLAAFYCGNTSQETVPG